jgi:DNA-binding NtrC family response regulator
MAEEKLTPIILVEDDESWAATITSRLGKFYSISHFISGEDTVEKLEQIRPKFIILDYHLAGQMSGLDTLKIIRKKTPESFVIMFSGQDDVKTAVEILDNGAYDYVVKGDNAFNRLKIIIRNIEAQENLRDQVMKFQVKVRRDRFWLTGVVIGIFFISLIIYLNTCPYGRPFLQWDPFNIAARDGCSNPAQAKPSLMEEQTP